VGDTELANRAEGTPRPTERIAQGDVRIHVMYDDPAAEAEAKRRLLAKLAAELGPGPDGAKNSEVNKEGSSSTEVECHLLGCCQGESDTRAHRADKIEF
jgi:hypothetical protein